jgi:glycosyltransferase involved in cell wall biosynthesis
MMKLCQVGHPFNPIGTGRATRLAFAAARAGGIEVSVRDVYKFQKPETALARAMLPLLTDEFGAVNLFHLNGDEIAPALAHLGGMPAGYNIVAPFWELPRFPQVWAEQVEKFDEVWAPSAFIRDTLTQAVKIPVTSLPMATAVDFAAFLDRKAFGIPENSFAFLTFFDGRSYVERKNPHAVVACFRRVAAARPFARTCLVIKLHGGENAPEGVKNFLAGLEDLGERVVVLNEAMPEEKVHNLIRCCDAFVSLHRSEGFGLGIAEAMFLGKPAIATAWSGNMTFMTAENSYPIAYALVPVPENAYPHWEIQEWAEPDADEAAAVMLRLLDEPAHGREIGKIASREMRQTFSYRAAGLRYAARLKEVSSAF